MRKSYHTFLISLYQTGKEHLLPLEVRSSIPASTASGFRNRKHNHYYGSEWDAALQDVLNSYELQLKHQKLKRIIKMIEKVWVAFSKIEAYAVLKKKETREFVIDQIQALSAHIPKQKVLMLIGFSNAQYEYALNRVKLNCSISPLRLCRRRHPNQLTQTEIETIQTLMNNPETCHWPASSLYYYARRSKLIQISLSTFYKYLHILGVNRIFHKPKHKRVGIRACLPNQYLHVDTTFWTLPDGVRTANVFVSDNYSRAILGFCSSEVHSFTNVQIALKQAIEMIKSYHPKTQNINLLTDGGSENHALPIAELLEKNKDFCITKLVALKDVRFSNSSVEAINKTFKRFLRFRIPQNFEEHQRAISEFVQDYCQQRPHISLNGLTPLEAYTLTENPLDQSDLASAKHTRIAQNQHSHCSSCCK